MDWWELINLVMYEPVDTGFKAKAPAKCRALLYLFFTGRAVLLPGPA